MSGSNLKGASACSQESKIAELDKGMAVMVERTEGIKGHVSDIADSVKLMQRLILGFIISCALIITTSILKDNFTGRALATPSTEKASPKAVEEKVNGK